MRNKEKENKYSFIPSELSDDSIKAISRARESIIKIWNTGKGEYGDDVFDTQEIEFSKAIKQIYVCLPNTNMPGHWNHINFLVELKDDLSDEVSRNGSDIVGDLRIEMQKLFKDIKVNTYFKSEMQEGLKTGMAAPSTLQQKKAIIYTGVPISEFNFQTLKEFHDQVQTNFENWQKQEVEEKDAKSSSSSVSVDSNELKGQVTPPSSSPKSDTKGDSPLRKQEQLKEFQNFFELSDEQLQQLQKSNAAIVDQMMDKFVNKLDLGKSSRGNLEAMKLKQESSLGRSGF